MKTFLVSMRFVPTGDDSGFIPSDERPSAWLGIGTILGWHRAATFVHAMCRIMPTKPGQVVSVPASANSDVQYRITEHA